MIVSKDSGFSESSALLGSPPKVIWLRVGIAPPLSPTWFFAPTWFFVPRQLGSQIFESGEEGCLVLRYPNLT